jgi:F-box/leucine-rich repeat protein 10/11
MRRIASFKPQYRHAAARAATPPPPAYEPLSPLLPPSAPVAASPARAHHRDDARQHSTHANRPDTHTAAAPEDSSPQWQHALPGPALDGPPQRAAAAPLPPRPHPRPNYQWALGSPIEALADAAVTSQPSAPPYPEHTRRASYAAAPLAHHHHHHHHHNHNHHSHPRDQPHTLDERPAKRARSEFYSASSPTYPLHHDRPATSHNPGWSYNVEHMADTGMRIFSDDSPAATKQEHNPDKRLSDAQLLLDFFQVSAHTAQTPPSTAKRLSVSHPVGPVPFAPHPAQPSPHLAHHTHHTHHSHHAPTSPYAVASQHPTHHAHRPRPPADGAHVPESPSLPTDIALPAPAVQTRTPPEDSAIVQPPPPMSNTAAAEETKPKKHQGWPKGKPRGPRSTPSTSRRKKATPKPKTAPPTSSKPTADQLQSPQSLLADQNGVPAAADASTSSSSHATPSHDLPAGPRRHSFSNSFLVLPATDLRSEAARAQSVPLQASLLTPTPTSKPAQRAKAQPIPEPELICASCKSSDSEIKVGDGEQWIGCDGCKEWYHYACAGFNSEREVRDVNKFYCEPCRPKFGQTTSRSTDAYWSNKSDLAQRFVNLSEPTLPLITPA